ncbi:hypothetical protein DL768_005550 [Monosporascus sp. mg162]|nr:hypothetical protein DL768_005550 [Monosporascus sp. mg162]
MQLLLTMAAIHTTTLTTTRILYDLAAHPETVADLREEIRTVLKDNNDVMTTKALFDMKLTDSVMRESQRLNPPFSDPEKFDPYRFYKLRTTDVPDPIGYRSREQYQFVSATKENMSFGLGRHACPGRFLAANEIKLILARILLEYDIKMPDGIETPYSNFSVGVTNGTDPAKKILLPWTIGFVALLLIFHRLSKIGRRPKDYPPGPPTLPLIGNLHQVPREKVHLQFQKWAEEYGPVYSLILGTKALVVLSSDQAIKDLLDKRSGIYSSRPEMYLGSMVGGGFRMLLMEYGETWRMIRRIVQNSLNIKAARTYVPYQDLENKAMLVGFLEQPALFMDHIRRYTNSLSTQMMFGFRTTSLDDPKLKRLYHGFEEFGKVMGAETAALVDLFPVLRYLPDLFLPLRRHAKELHKKECDLFVGHYADTKRRLKEGTAKPCFCVDLVRAQEQEGFSDEMAAYALLCFPEVVKLGQAELDSVCGNRLPDLNDLPNLPYIRGCMKESLRWMPTVPVGVNHAVIHDDEYMGYKIPKGAGIMLNVWAIGHDPKRHPAPQRFDPARWAHDSQTSAEAANNPDVTKRDHFVFGAGRRLCQGMHIADRSLFLAISRLLWAFDFRRPIDETTGQEIVPDMGDLTDGLFMVPKPFRAHIVPRSEYKAQRVREEWSKMTELLDSELQWKDVPEGVIWRDYEPIGAQK